MSVMHAQEVPQRLSPAWHNPRLGHVLRHRPFEIQLRKKRRKCGGFVQLAEIHWENKAEGEVSE